MKESTAKIICSLLALNAMLQAIYAKDLAVAIILLFVVLIYTFFACLESKAETHEKENVSSQA